MIAEVIVNVENRGVDKVFDYSCFDGVNVGDRVLVPFGKKQIEGFVLNLKEKTNFDEDKLKCIIKKLDETPVLNKEMLKLSNFMIKKYNLKTIDTLKLFVPSGLIGGKVKQIVKKKYKLADIDKIDTNLIKKNAKNQFALLSYLMEKEIEFASVLNEKFGTSSVKRFEELEFITPLFEQKIRKPQVKTVEKKNITLTDLQKKVIEKIESEQNRTILLHGVTGSGKTEVYMNVIENVLNSGKTAIMLVPEISLTPQVMQNFVSRFNENVAILHSGLSVGERFDEWQRIKKGEAKIVVGARSAIFAPIENLGVIIIDEEHDTSYYSESNPRYFTHEVAKFRAEYNGCNLILGSATPSIEDYFKAQNGEYELIEMPVRVNREDMPQIEIVDMMSEIRNGNSGMFSNLLLNRLNDTVEKGEQAIIFLNRRGYNSFVMCRDCGYNAKCEDCDVSLVYHKEDNELKCHYCGKRYHMLSECPNCHSKNIKYGAIGTQKVVEELQKYYPNVKIFRMDNDTVSTKNSHEEILSEFGKTKPSILVGTQMIAKGHDFPLCTFVGIIDADLSLHFSDFRANERTFSLITQVSGRAGRSEKIGHVVLQTYCPKHYTYRYSQSYDYNKFFEREINLRKVTNFPPFSVITRVLITSENEEKVRAVSKSIFDSIKTLKEQNIDSFIYLGAMKSPVKRIERKYRYQILMRITPSTFNNIIQKIYEITNKINEKNVSIFVEINPQNLS
ncbi:MAG: primosomal protein N' [Clostridiales bacterium]|nr:primosomal protein N' [Candidatus Apopatousia equi]